MTNVFDVVMRGDLGSLLKIVGTGKVKLTVRNSVKESLLHQAVKYQHLNIVKYLFSKSIDPELRDSSQNTALHVACTIGNHEVVSFLLQKRAHVNPVNGEKNTPLHLATIKGDKKVVKMLMEYHADISIKNSGGYLPEEFAGDEIKKLYEKFKDYQKKKEFEKVKKYALALKKENEDLKRELIHLKKTYSNVESFTILENENEKLKESNESLKEELKQYESEEKWKVLSSKFINTISKKNFDYKQFFNQVQNLKTSINVIFSKDQMLGNLQTLKEEENEAAFVTLLKEIDDKGEKLVQNLQNYLGELFDEEIDKLFQLCQHFIAEKQEKKSVCETEILNLKKVLSAVEFRKLKNFQKIQNEYVKILGKVSSVKKEKQSLVLNALNDEDNSEIKTVQKILRQKNKDIKDLKMLLSRMEKDVESAHCFVIFKRRLKRFFLVKNREFDQEFKKGSLNVLEKEKEMNKKTEEVQLLKVELEKQKQSIEKQKEFLNLEKEKFKQIETEKLEKEKQEFMKQAELKMNQKIDELKLMEEEKLLELSRQKEKEKDIAKVEEPEQVVEETFHGQGDLAVEDSFLEEKEQTKFKDPILEEEVQEIVDVKEEVETKEEEVKEVEEETVNEISEEISQPEPNRKPKIRIIQPKMYKHQMRKKKKPQAPKESVEENREKAPAVPKSSSPGVRRGVRKVVRKVGKRKKSAEAPEIIRGHTVLPSHFKKKKRSSLRMKKRIIPKQIEERETKPTQKRVVGRPKQEPVVPVVSKKVARKPVQKKVVRRIVKGRKEEIAEADQKKVEPGIEKRRKQVPEVSENPEEEPQEIKQESDEEHFATQKKKRKSKGVKTGKRGSVLSIIKGYNKFQGDGGVSKISRKKKEREEERRAEEEENREPEEKEQIQVEVSEEEEKPRVVRKVVRRVVRKRSGGKKPVKGKVVRRVVRRSSDAQQNRDAKPVVRKVVRRVVRSTSGSSSASSNVQRREPVVKRVVRRVVRNVPSGKNPNVVRRKVVSQPDIPHSSISKRNDIKKGASEPKAIPTVPSSSKSKSLRDTKKVTFKKEDDILNEKFEIGDTEISFDNILENFMSSDTPSKKGNQEVEPTSQVTDEVDDLFAATERKSEMLTFNQKGSKRRAQRKRKSLNQDQIDQLFES